MGFVQVDKEKCHRDGICISECPVKVLQQDDDGYPVPVKDAEALCIGCGHCVAFCSAGAISIGGKVNISPDTCTPLNKELKVSPEAVEQLLKSRRSVRAYKEQVVPHSTLTKLMDTVSYAPTGMNRQCVNWIMVEDPKVTRSYAGLVIDWMRENEMFPEMIVAWDHGVDLILRGAPHVAIAYAPTDYASSQADCIIATSFMDIAAKGYGLGACWAGFLMYAAVQYPPLTEALSLPEGHVPYAALMLGQPKYKNFRIPPRQAAKVTWK